MMQRIIYAAALLLIVQIGLVAALNSGGSSLDAVTPDTLFVEFDPNTITEIGITDKDSQQLILQKEDSDWLIISAYSAPADAVLINDLLAKLSKAKQGFAVATSKGAAIRFRTAKDEFERHLLFKKGDQVVADFYLGTSAGMRNSHVRKNDEHEVFTLPVSSFEVEADADKWLDKKAFQLDKEALKMVQIGDIEIKKEEGGWQIADLDSTEVKTQELEKLIEAVTDLQVQSVLDPEKAEPLFAKDLDFQFIVSTESKENIQYSFAKQDDYRVLKISESDLYFKVYDWQVDNLQEFTKEKLVQHKDDVEQPETTNISG